MDLYLREGDLLSARVPARHLDYGVVRFLFSSPRFPISSTSAASLQII